MTLRGAASPPGSRRGTRSTRLTLPNEEKRFVISSFDTSALRLPTKSRQVHPEASTMREAGVTRARTTLAGGGPRPLAGRCACALNVAALAVGSSIGHHESAVQRSSPAPFAPPRIPRGFICLGAARRRAKLMRMRGASSIATAPTNQMALFASNASLAQLRCIASRAPVSRTACSVVASAATRPLWLPGSAAPAHLDGRRVPAHALRSQCRVGPYLAFPVLARPLGLLQPSTGRTVRSLSAATACRQGCFASISMLAISRMGSALSAHLFSPAFLATTASIRSLLAPTRSS